MTKRKMNPKAADEDKSVHPVVAGLAAALRTSENLRATERLVEKAGRETRRAHELQLKAQVIRLVVLRNRSE